MQSPNEKDQESRVFKISVCIPCYNQARYIENAIESIKIQRMNDVEIIIVDDGSGDETALLANRKDVKYIYQSNKGLSAARNTGLRAALGKYITFLDADDVYLPGAFEAAIEVLETKPELSFVYGDYQLIDSQLNLIAEVNIEEKVNNYEELLKKNFIAMHATVFYRRDRIIKIGGFNESLKACEDYEIYLRIVRNNQIGKYPRTAAGYRQHESNMTGDPSLMLKSSLIVLNGESSYVRGTPRLLAAYEQGIRFWKDYYGSRLADKVVEGDPKGIGKTWEGLWIGLTHDERFPLRLARSAARRIRSVATK